MRRRRLDESAQFHHSYRYEVRGHKFPQLALPTYAQHLRGLMSSDFVPFNITLDTPTELPQMCLHLNTSISGYYSKGRISHISIKNSKQDTSTC